MSFILDALKKSESDRQRQSGPALFEVKVAPPKVRFPVWAIAIAALLVVNMVIVGWMLLRRSSHGEETAATNTSPAAAGGPTSGTATAPVTSGNGPPPAFASTPAPSYASAPPPASSAPPASVVPPGVSPPNGMPNNSAPPPLARTQFAPPPNQQDMGSTEPRLPTRDQNEPTLAGNTREPAVANSEPAANPDDYAPATDPGASLFKGHVRRGTESGLMLYQDAALVPGATLPQLRLDLHVYAASPQDRFALINMHKLHEGDSLQGGVRVEAITPDGVVMSHNGSKFLLPRE